MWCLFKNRRLCISADHLFCYVTYNIHRTESWREAVRQSKKRCVFWHYLFDTACGSGWCDRIFYDTAACCSVQQCNQTGTYRGFFLLFPSIFPLHCRYHARCGKICRADVRHACILVHHKDHIHHGYCAFYSEDPGHLLGIPIDLVNQFGDLFDLLLKSQLAV